jgi:hypothetical protein
MDTLTVPDAIAALLVAYRDALFPLADLRRADPRDVNGLKVAFAVRGVREGLAAVDAAEAALALALINASAAPTTVARRCGYAPATMRRMVAEVTA